MPQSKKNPKSKPRKTPLLTAREVKHLERIFKSERFRQSTSKDFGIELNRSMIEYMWSEIESFIAIEKEPLKRSQERQDIAGIVQALEKLLASLAELRTQPDKSGRYFWYLIELNKIFRLWGLDDEDWRTDKPGALEKRLTLLHDGLRKRFITARRGRPFRDRTDLIHAMMLVYEEAGGTVSANYSPSKGEINSPFVRFATHLLASGGERTERVFAPGLAADIRAHLRWLKASAAGSPPKGGWQRTADMKRRLMLRFDKWPEKVK